MTGKAEHVIPTVTNLAGDISESSLGNYFGIPTELDSDTHLLPAFDVAAYGKIIDEWYRSDALGTEIFTGLEDGDNTAAWGVI